jgi:hypothetical protein
MTDSAALENGLIVESVDTERLAKVTGDNARLRAEVRQALARAQRAEAEVARVRSSTKFVIGNLLVQAAKHPRNLLALPRDLLRLYRLRKHRRSAPEEVPAALSRAHRSELSDEHAARLLLPRVAAQPRAALAIAGALTPVHHRMWSGCALVTSALPHDGAALVRDTDPDIVIIDTSAARPGGTWAHLGNPAATDRSIAALEMATAARERGRPSVLLRTTTRAHTSGLDWLGERCDLVVDGPGSDGPVTWHPGIDLRAWVSASDSARVSAGVSAGVSPDSSPPQPRLAVLAGVPSSAADWAMAHGLQPGYIRETAPTWPALSRLIHGAAIAVQACHPSLGSGVDTALLGALANGARVVTTKTPQLMEILGAGSARDAVVYVPDTAASAGTGTVALEAALEAALDEALQRGRLSPVEHWHVLRQLFSAVTAPVTLDDLCRRLGLGADPALVRGVALVDDPTIEGDAFVEFVQAQVHAPRAVITSRELSDRARDIFENLAIAILSTQANPIDAPSAENPRTDGLSSAAQLSDCALLAQVDAATLVSAHPHTLNDAVIGFEVSTGDAIHLGSTVNPAQATVAIFSRQAALDGTPSTALAIDHPGLIA